jgi:hypothetical protein
LLFTGNEPYFIIHILTTTEVHVRVILIAFSVVIAASVSNAVTINSGDWPMDTTYIGTWWEFDANSTDVSISPFDSTATTWDFTTGPDQITLTAEIRTKSDGPNHGMFGGTFSILGTPDPDWIYASKSPSEFTIYGTEDSEGIVVYSSPYEKAIQFPLTLGVSWVSVWTGYDSQAPTEVNFTHAHSVVAEGWVKTPAFGTDSVECLVLRVVYDEVDTSGGIHWDDHYIGHYWIVPGLGEVVAQISVDGDQNPQFTTASVFYRLSSTSLTDVPDELVALPNRIALAVAPNPFNPATTFSFALSANTDARLEVFDVLGRRVATLHDGPLPAGEHSVVWDAGGCASGLYVARLTTGMESATTRAVLLR